MIQKLRDAALFYLAAFFFIFFNLIEIIAHHMGLKGLFPR